MDISPVVSLRGADRLLVPIRAGTVDLTCNKTQMCITIQIFYLTEALCLTDDIAN
jgi:hypothetical protein